MNSVAKFDMLIDRLWLKRSSGGFRRQSFTLEREKEREREETELRIGCEDVFQPIVSVVKREKEQEEKLMGNSIRTRILEESIVQLSLFLPLFSFELNVVEHQILTFASN